MYLPKYVKNYVGFSVNIGVEEMFTQVKWLQRTSSVPMSSAKTLREIRCSLWFCRYEYTY